MDDEPNLITANEDFHHARNRADLQMLLARLKGEPNQLLSYDEVRQMLRLQGGIEIGVQDIPLDAIVGSVGRYSDFTRDFLPLEEIRAERWARVYAATTDMSGLPPIDVYKIGEAYFVRDGNHRVSVARSLGATHIQAYVTEVQTSVPLTPDVSLDDLILKAEYSVFLEQTDLSRLRPEADLSVTTPGQYPILLEHIDVHRYFMGIDFQHPISYEEAVIHWYDQVYLPIIEEIRKQGILRSFPGRTEADLYLWIAEHRRELEAVFGFPVRTETVISKLTDEQKASWIARLSDRLHNLVIPAKLESGPAPGTWRVEVIRRENDRLFFEVLTPVNGKEDGWCALEQAIQVAQREDSKVHGLHVIPLEEEEPSNLQEIRHEFMRRCREGQVQGDLAIGRGDLVEQTCLRVVATDLVVMNLSYPPEEAPLSRLQSGFPNLVRRCPRPILATPQVISEMSKALLAFDGSPKAWEALYVATYLAKKWGTTLQVLSVVDGSKVGEQTLNQSKEYLERHEVQAEYTLNQGYVSDALHQALDTGGCDLLIMGGYGLRPMLEVVLGSTVDQMLRRSKVPVLICR